MNLTAGLPDREAAALALIAAGATYAVALDWRLGVVAGAGVLAAKIGSELMLRRADPPPIPLPGLTPKERNVAWHMYLRYTRPAIARRLGMPLAHVEKEIRDIKAKWMVHSAEQIVGTVQQIREQKPPKKQSQRRAESGSMSSSQASARLVWA